MSMGAKTHWRYHQSRRTISAPPLEMQTLGIAGKYITQLELDLNAAQVDGHNLEYQMRRLSESNKRMSKICERLRETRHVSNYCDALSRIKAITEEILPEKKEPVMSELLGDPTP